AGGRLGNVGDGDDHQLQAALLEIGPLLAAQEVGVFKSQIGHVVEVDDAADQRVGAVVRGVIQPRQIVHAETAEGHRAAHGERFGKVEDKLGPGGQEEI